MWLKNISEMVIATGNPKKLNELNQVLTPLDIQLYPQSKFDTPEAEETGLSFIENAIIKARNAAKYSGLPAVADDSGLEVDYLNGAPGIYSSRYADGKGDHANNEKLLNALSGVPKNKRQARFQCVIAVVKHELDPTPLIFQGTWEGEILESLQGAAGFGYDPLFFVPELNCSSAELMPETKNKLSHRGKALNKFIEILK